MLSLEFDNYVYKKNPSLDRNGQHQSYRRTPNVATAKFLPIDTTDTAQVAVEDRIIRRNG